MSTLTRIQVRAIESYAWEVSVGAGNTCPDATPAEDDLEWVTQFVTGRGRPDACEEAHDIFRRAFKQCLAAASQP